MATRESRGFSGWRRLASTTLVLVLAVTSILTYLDWRELQHELLETARKAGTLDRQPAVARWIPRWVHRADALALVARTLLAEELDRRWIADLPESEQRLELERGIDRLAAARRLALEALSEQPSSWRAATVLGASNFLLYSRRQDRRLITRPETWERPLAWARTVAPADPGPTRLLAAAKLGNWARLPPDQRADTRLLLREAFRDPTTLALLFGQWIRIAPSLDDALEPVPAEPEALRVLQRFFLRENDLERYVEVSETLRPLELDDLKGRLAQARRRIAGGEPLKGGREALWVGRQLRASRDHAELFAEVVAAVPPGVIGDADQRWLGPWTDWARNQCEWIGCPLPPATLIRLAAVVTGVDVAGRAELLLRGGNLAAGEAEERASGATEGPRWTGYWLAKAELLFDRGLGAEAESALARLDPAVRRSSRALRLGPDGSRRAAGATGPAASWPSSDWERVRGGSRLAVVSAAADTMEIETLAVPADGAVVELLLDGRHRGLEVASAGARLRLAGPIREGPHLVEIRELEGGSVRPGSARLSDGSR